MGRSGGLEPDPGRRGPAETAVLVRSNQASTRHAILPAFALATAAIIAMPQLAPTAELSAWSVRSYFDFLPDFPLLGIVAMLVSPLMFSPATAEKYPPNLGQDMFYFGGFIILILLFGLARPEPRKRPG